MTGQGIGALALASSEALVDLRGKLGAGLGGLLRLGVVLGALLLLVFKRAGIAVLAIAGHLEELAFDLLQPIGKDSYQQVAIKMFNFVKMKYLKTEIIAIDLNL